MQVSRPSRWLAVLATLYFLLPTVAPGFSPRTLFDLAPDAHEPTTLLAQVGNVAPYLQCRPGVFGPDCDTLCQCPESADCDDGPSGRGLCVFPPRGSGDSEGCYEKESTCDVPTTPGLTWVDRLRSFDISAPSARWNSRDAARAYAPLLRASPTPLAAPLQELLFDATAAEAALGPGWRDLRGIDLAGALAARDFFLAGRSLEHGSRSSTSGGTNSSSRAHCGGRRCGRSGLLSHAYGGHQYGEWRVLGDGRAGSLGFVVSSPAAGRQPPSMAAAAGPAAGSSLGSAGGMAWEVGLKGSGRTPFSRGGDGRAALLGCVREALGSAALRGVGIPTQLVPVVLSGGAVIRDRSYSGDAR